jgi:hypothetical protein
MKDTNDHDKPLRRMTHTRHIWMITGGLVCVLFGACMAWGVHALWQLDDIPVTSTFNEQMMHRKTRTMGQILDGLVRGDLRRVENSAEHMKSIGLHVNWYSSSEVYENNNEPFRQSTFDLIDAARRRDLDAAKESALRLERSCIECHALINGKELPTQ